MKKTGRAWGSREGGRAGERVNGEWGMGNGEWGMGNGEWANSLYHLLFPVTCSLIAHYPGVFGPGFFFRDLQVDVRGGE